MGGSSTAPRGRQGFINRPEIPACPYNSYNQVTTTVISWGNAAPHGVERDDATAHDVETLAPLAVRQSHGARNKS